MKWTLIFLIFLSIKVFAPTSDNGMTNERKLIAFQEIEKAWELEMFWRSICWVESRGNEKAINEKEKAYGICQIRQVRLDNYYKLTGIRHDLKEMLYPEKAKKVFMFYFERNKSFEKAARRWNGSGEMTDRYWGLVNGRFEKLIKNK